MPTKNSVTIACCRPATSAPFASWPSFDDEFIAVASRVLASGKVNYWTGDEGRQFEAEFAAFCGASYGVAVANGTVALELALLACDVGPGDEVVVTSRTFLASASSIVLRGATPVFADVDVDSQNITPETIESIITPRTKAIIAVHLAGWPCEMQGLRDIADRYDLKIIEDCAQSHGATYQGQPVGSWGDVAAFSFCQDKIMTTGGEGGMLVTNDRKIRDRAWSYKDHGKSWEAVYEQEHPPGFRWLHKSFGTNGRLTEMQSALGRLALKKLPDWLSKRREYAGLLNEAFSKLPGLRVTIPPAHIQHAYYKYYAFVRPERLAPGWHRDGILEALTKQGVACFGGSCSEIYLEDAFTVAGLQPPTRLPVAKELGETSLMFLVHPTLSKGDILATCRAVEEVMAHATASASREAA